jgi:hypothetical protein
MNFAIYFLALVVLALPSAVSAQVDFNPRLIPTGHRGFTEDRVRATTERPGPSDGTGSFRIACEFSHMNQDDPIVFPGQKGAAHLHTYFGNKGTNFSSTSPSIAGTGASTCQGGTINRSAYWTPSMIDTRQGRPLAPVNAVVYYKSGYHRIPLANIQPVPVGLRMLAGDMHAMGPSSHNYSFHCDGGPGPSMSGKTIPNCSVGSQVVMSIWFPQCWNGRDLDSPDHKSHMSFRVGDAGGVCPSTHRVAISEITINVHYTVTEVNSPRHWRLVSDHYPADQPGGYSAHADWMNGWRPYAARRWNNNCIQAARDCGMGLLGGALRLH